MIVSQIKLVDIVIELLDARVPYSSQNPDINELADKKKRIVVLNKSDLADKSITDTWVDHFAAAGIVALPIDSKKAAKSKSGIGRLQEVAADIARARLKKRGVIRAMVVGIPNVGKSTLINTLSGRAAAKTANRPAVTRGRQWVGTDGFLLMDTPGILWPRADEDEVAQNLAITGAIADRVVDTQELAEILVRWLLREYPTEIQKRYGDMHPRDSLNAGILDIIAARKGHRQKGGVLDVLRTSIMILADFRAGLLGRVSLEIPQPPEE